MRAHNMLFQRGDRSSSVYLSKNLVIDPGIVMIWCDDVLWCDMMWCDVLRCVVRREPASGNAKVGRCSAMYVLADDDGMAA